VNKGEPDAYDDKLTPPARIIGSVPGQDPAVELEDLRLQDPQLGAKGGGTRPGECSGTRWSLASVAMASRCSTPLRPTAATMPNSAM
jgi:hypothetical protein